ncbi:MAG: hypothetical protein NVSMB46_07000 [Candidatus Saccharimonadales bacterium]
MAKFNRGIQKLLILLPIVGVLTGAVYGIESIVKDKLRTTNKSHQLNQQIVLMSKAKKICQLTGETDQEFNTAHQTINKTASRYGLEGTDNGYSFEHEGKLWFLFGDTIPTPLFNGKANSHSDLPRQANYNDAIATSSSTSANNCIDLNFIPNTNGAYTSPRVATSPGQPPVTLRTNEVPIAGISEAGKMYVVFSTDNFASNPVGQPSKPSGGGTRSVMAVSTQPATLQFKYLYDLSGEPNGKFTYVAMADNNNGYVYVWGTTAGGNNFRHSPVYFARKKVSNIDQAGGMEYFSGLSSAGQPHFESSESSAAPLFKDNPDNCTGELSVQWNKYLEKWVMLYNCADNTPANPRGIYMRIASEPWGPWGDPITLFNTKDGLCKFIHKAITAGEKPCDKLSGRARMDVQGGDYSPYMVERYTTGKHATSTTPASSTFYYTLSTWNPYEVILMSSSVELK